MYSTVFNVSALLKNAKQTSVHLLVNEPHIFIVFVIVAITHSNIKPKWVRNIPNQKYSILLISSPNSKSKFEFARTEKHKTYHISNDLLARDGFKKFMKNEPCSFDRCRFSLQSNHIHCIRENCFYVLHSSGQMFSHKRKHERHDSEQAYQKYKLTQKADNLSADMDGNDIANIAELAGSNAKNLFSNNLSTFLSSYVENASKNDSLLTDDSLDILQQLHLQKQALLNDQSTASTLGDKNSENGEDSNAIDNNNYDAADSLPSKSFGQNENLSDNNRSINPTELEQLKDIYLAMEKAKQKQLNALLFAQNNFNGNDQSEPVNLNMKKESADNMNPYLLSAVVQKMHTQTASSNLQQITSIDGLFNRKRGRPPKNRVVEVYGNVSRYFNCLVTYGMEH